MIFKPDFVKPFQHIILTCFNFLLFYLNKSHPIWRYLRKRPNKARRRTEAEKLRKVSLYPRDEIYNSITSRKQETSSIFSYSSRRLLNMKNCRKEWKKKKNFQQRLFSLLLLCDENKKLFVIKLFISLRIFRYKLFD